MEIFQVYWSCGQCCCLQGKSPYFSKLRPYSNDNKTFDFTDVRLGTLRTKQLQICLQEIKYLLLGNTQLKRWKPTCSALFQICCT